MIKKIFRPGFFSQNAKNFGRGIISCFIDSDITLFNKNFLLEVPKNFAGDLSVFHKNSVNEKNYGQEGRGQGGSITKFC